MALKEEQFECVFCLSIFKYLYHFFGQNFIEEFLIYIKRRITFKGLLVLDLSFWKVKQNTNISVDKIKDILINKLSFVFLDKVGEIGKDQRELYIFLSY